MDQDKALSAFAALSAELRLRITRLLVVAGPEGMAAGAIARSVETSASNVSFHLKELERAGLVGSRRDSRSIVYSADYVGLAALVRFLMEDCCSGRPEICYAFPQADCGAAAGAGELG